MNTKILGSKGEEAAVQYLKKKGYRILERNFKTKWGELDIVVQKDGKIIFVEVKTLRQKSDFAPEDQVNFKKKQQLIKMAQIYLSYKHLSLDIDYQIDIVAIEVDWAVEVVNVKHFKNAIADHG
ncbi:MAG: YraN family protein [Candidatus Pacebacteria bacterium]|nr:YraN family protein [Candidatus Paceibacterota bacterium]